MRKSLYDYCIENNRTELLAQWDTAANLPLTPTSVTCGSSRKIWWHCEKGHHWQQEPWIRSVQGSGCPVCAGKKIVAGDNDLKTRYPAIAKEWHPTKNGKLRPEQVSPYTHRKVWWRCKKGHEWQAEVRLRVAGNGCPYCGGRAVLSGENDLAVLYPELASQWHPTKNGSLTPQDIRPGTKKKVWWRCEKGHEWQATVASRVKGTGCPYCAGKLVMEGTSDLASRYPDLAAEWHPTKNGMLRPNMVTTQSNRVVWWQDNLGHEWRAKVASRVDGSACPFCSNKKLLSGFNDLQTRYPEIAKEWDSKKNGITPDQVMPTKRKVWWRCPNGHEYQSQISARAYQNIGCPVCAGKTIIAGVNDLATLYPNLAKEWHPTKNGALKTTMVAGASNRSVWWQDEFGHEWKAMISDRSSGGSGCPYCAGKKVLVGFNDLASQEPKIAAEWHPTLNGTRTPEMFTCGSNQKIWWQCSEGHVWQAPIGRRYYLHSGCPVCNGNVSKKKLERYKRMMQKSQDELERKMRDQSDTLKKGCQKVE